MDYQKSQDIGELNKGLAIAVYDNDISVIDKIMANDKYPTLTKDEKEQALFDNLIGYVEFQERGYDVLSHLIIGYKISSENSLNRLGGDISKTVNTLFMARTFDERLSNVIQDNLRLIEECHHESSDCSKSIEEKYALQLALAIHVDVPKYFIKLLSPSVFTQLSIKDKFNKAIIAVGLSENRRNKYLNYLIFDTAICRDSVEITERSSYWSMAGFNHEYIHKLFDIKEMDNALPVNHVNKEKFNKL